MLMPRQGHIVISYQLFCLAIPGGLLRYLVCFRQVKREATMSGLFDYRASFTAKER